MLDQLTKPYTSKGQKGAPLNSPPFLERSVANSAGETSLPAAALAVRSHYQGLSFATPLFSCFVKLPAMGTSIARVIPKHCFALAETSRSSATPISVIVVIERNWHSLKFRCGFRVHFFFICHDDRRLKLLQSLIKRNRLIGLVT